MSTPQVTVIPPAEPGYGHGGHAPSFDRHQFQHAKARAVSARYTPEGWETTGIAFSDLRSMYVHRREVTPIRRLPTPEWAMSLESMREVILKHLEESLYIRIRSGSHVERLARIDAKAKERVPKMASILSELSARYRELASDPNADPEALRHVGIQVQNVDTQIVLARRGIATVMVAAVYGYYHNGWNATQLANELGVKPPMVRIWLWRLNHLANGSRKPRRCPRPMEWTPEKLKVLFVMRTTGKTFRECGQAFKISTNSVESAWRKYFGNLKSKLSITRQRGWTSSKLKLLFVLRTTGKTVEECAVVFGVKPISIYAVWRKYFGDLNQNLRKRILSDENYNRDYYRAGKFGLTVAEYRRCLEVAGPVGRAAR